jgi:hypothetical protein
LCSFRCRVDSRWTHDRARSGEQIEQPADGDEFVGLLCHLDPPEHKAPSRREVMWIAGSLAEDRKHAEFSIVEYPRDVEAEDCGGKPAEFAAWEAIPDMSV